MPYIGTHTTVKITPEKEVILKEKLGKAIEAIPGKTEAWLMCGFEDNCRLWFKGDAFAPSAFVEVKLLGTASPEYYEKLTAIICRILADELDIPAERTYVKYEECKYWGWNNINF